MGSKHTPSEQALVALTLEVGKRVARNTPLRRQNSRTWNPQRLHRFRLACDFSKGARGGAQGGGVCGSPWQGVAVCGCILQSVAVRMLIHRIRYSKSETSHRQPQTPIPIPICQVQRYFVRSNSHTFYLRQLSTSPSQTTFPSLL